MTRVEFGRVKQGDILFNQQHGLYRVVDLESQSNRTKKCVVHSVSKEGISKLVIDETECSLWVIHR